MKKFFRLLLSLSIIFSILSPVFAEDDKSYTIISLYNGSDTLTGIKIISGTDKDEIQDFADNFAPAYVRATEWNGDFKETKSYFPEEVINIIHTNDTHGAIQSSESVIGTDLISSFKKTYKNAILADSGDATQGLPALALSKGADAIELMNAAEYDVMAAGNHEFDYGYETLLENAKSAAFPILSANTYYNGSPALAGDYKGGTSNGQNIIINAGGTDIGFFAITTTNTKTSTNPNGIKDLEFRDETEEAKEQIEKLKNAGADVIVALCHLGSSDNVSCTSAELAKNLEGSGLLAIIDGHSHTVINNYESGILIAQTGTGNTLAGRIAIKKSKDGYTAKEYFIEPEDAKFFNSDNSVKSMIDEIISKQSEYAKQIVGTSGQNLWGGYINNIAEARIAETNLGNLITDAMVYGAENLIETNGSPVVAVTNGGSIRASVPKGDISYNDLINIMPFGNTIMYKSVTPKILFEIMETSLAHNSAQDSETGMITSDLGGGFLQISGMSVKYDPNKPEGNKIISLKINDKEIDKKDDKTKIILASNDYLIAGGDGYSILSELPTMGEGGGLVELMAEYIGYLTEKNGTIDNKITEGRITTAYEPKDYSAKVYIYGENKEKLKNSKAEIYIDGQKLNVTTNDDGIAEVTLSDGPHEASLYEDGKKSVYINNYSGAGLAEVSGEYIVTYPELKL